MRLPDRMRAAGETAWLPFALAAATLTLIVVAAAVAPASLRGSIVLGVASACFLVGYVVWPKPALLVFALFALFDHTVAQWLTPQLRHVDEVVVPVLFFAALLRTRPWQRGLLNPVREGALLVLFVAGAGSSLVSGVPAAVWLLGLFLLLKTFAFLYVVLWHDFSSRDLRQLYPLVLAAGIVLIVLVPLEVLDANRFREALNLSLLSEPREGLPSVKSLLYRPVLFAWFTSFVGLYLVAGYVVMRRWWLLIGAALFGIATVLAGRRRAIAGVALGLVAGAASVAAATRSLRAAILAWWPVALGSLALALLFLPSLVGLADLTLNPRQAPEVSPPDARMALYTTSVAVARDHFPFGVGFGRYGSGTSRDPYSPVYAQYGLDKIDGLSPEHSNFVSDTFWPRILGESGVVGLAALLLFTVILTVELWRAARDAAGEPLRRAFLLGTWMVFVQGLVETLASSMFDSPPRIYLLFGAVGVALSLARRPAEVSARGVRESEADGGGVDP